MRDSTPSQLRFPAIASFAGSARSSDFGRLLLRGIEPLCGLIGRLAEAIHDGRYPSSIEHSVVDLLRHGSIKVPAAMSTAMTPTACAATLCSSWRWGVYQLAPVEFEKQHLLSLESV